ncbi:MAG: class I SAM-dependent methyltransferase [Gammaproteobacteria bacterium]|nr:class I SAM-dependent methyltransferase [Gammaproteobacteria bacterium]
MKSTKPFSQSSEENKTVILEQLMVLYANSDCVLEIGSGTGQHAVHFARHLSHLRWQPTELAENVAGVNIWVEDAGLDNIEAPLVLDVAQQHWGLTADYDAVFSANTLHIMSILHVEKLFAGLGKLLNKDALFCCYGPFNKDGRFSSESNARFDHWLKQRDEASGIRDMSELTVFAEKAGFVLQEDIEMPVNNRILVWKMS